MEIDPRIDPTKVKINHRQRLFTKAQLRKLIDNGRNRDQDHPPVVRFFDPRSRATWLISEVDPDNPFLAFGLCDLGMQCPELGSVYLGEFSAPALEYIQVLGIERDLHFEGKHPMSVYATAARAEGRIVEYPNMTVQTT